MKNLGELRFKESNRYLISQGLRKCGIEVNTYDDNIEIIGKNCQRSQRFAKGDHRIAMSFNILNLVSQYPPVTGNKSILSSFPEFFNTKATKIMKNIVITIDGPAASGKGS